MKCDTCLNLKEKLTDAIKCHKRGKVYGRAKKCNSYVERKVFTAVNYNALGWCT